MLHITPQNPPAGFRKTVTVEIHTNLIYYLDNVHLYLQAESMKIAAVIANNRVKIPETRHKIEDIKNSRQRLIFDKRATLNDKYKEVKVMNQKMLMSKGRIFEAKSDLQKIEQSLAVVSI